ncbi:hypothetical protein LCGC14_2814680 [marine sediment metagenome]|uniref:Uncharacterized protein n=1 Tax=marine sediment metagenome TaxID=412755 RepID=A0A0F9AS93_9ZZZZ
MTPEKLMIDALKGIVPYPMLRRAVKVSVDAIRAAQAEQRQRIIAIIKGGDRPWQELVDAILKQEDE